MIREQTTVPVPEVLAYDFSKRYIESNYFFMTELKGEPFSKVMKKMGQENADRIREELAGYLYQIHGVKGNISAILQKMRDGSILHGKKHFFICSGRF